MAPKGKLAKLKAKRKAKPPKPELTKEQREALIKKNKKILIPCAVISLISLLIIATLIPLYMKLLEKERTVTGPFNELRKAMVHALEDDKVNESDPMVIAKEIRMLPEKTEQAQVEYQQNKIIYRNEFYKKSRSSSDSWQRHGKSSYYFSRGEKNWYDAEDFCLSKGAHLASIRSPEEQDFITSQIEHTSWIGLTTSNKEGKWSWSDGNSLEDENWFDEDLSKGRSFWKPNQDCAMIEPTSNHHNWKVNNCHQLHRWVCKNIS